MDNIMTEQEIRQIIREELAFMVKNKKLVFPFPIQILDGNDITLARGIGTKIGTASDQKLGFYGATPIVQQAKLIQPVGGGSSASDAIDNYARSAIGQLGQIFGNVGITAPYP